MASGFGAPPPALFEDTWARPFWIGPDAARDVWIAFGRLPDWEGEHPRRIMLSLRARTQRGLVSVSVSLTDPARTSPRWTAPPISPSASWGSLFLVDHDAKRKAVMPLLRADRYAFGGVVLGFGGGIGAHLFERDSEQHVGLAVFYSIDFSMPVLRLPNGALGFYVSANWAAFFAEAEESSAVWMGPSAGIEVLAGRLFASRGPFPVTRPESPLRRLSVRIGVLGAYVSPDDDLTAAFIMSFDITGIP